jgi:ATP-dependent DNA ligase
LDLKYWAYDFIGGADYEARFQYLYETINLGNYGLVIPTKLLENIVSLDEHFEHARVDGFEGLILRPPGVGYEIGKRSKSLIKIKKFLDAEFNVVAVGFTPDGWGILCCQIGNKTFNVTAPGSVEEKRHVHDNPEHYIGQLLKVKYANLTADGIPFHPTAVAFRPCWDL